MELQLTSEQRKLVGGKNKLDEPVIGKYRLAGQIAQTGMVFVTELLNSESLEERSVGEICRLTDSFLQNTVAGVYKSVEERGIALPTQICKNEISFGVAPEAEDNFQGGYIKPGDIVKVSLGVHIDGYTAQVCHTVVIRDDEMDRDTSVQSQPLVGNQADAICASFIATEAIISLLSVVLSADVPIAAANNGKITGEMIRMLVEKIAAIFRVQVCPGSKVRRVRRFLAGQSDVVSESDFKGYEWTKENEEKRQLSKIPGAVTEHDQNQLSNEFADDFMVQQGESWLIDVQMAATGGEAGILYNKDFTHNDNTLASVYSRDYSVTYGLRLQASRQMLTKSAAVTSVYPFKLSHVLDNSLSMNQAKLGLSELVQRHVFVPHNVKTTDFVPLDLYLKSNKTMPTAKEIKQASKPVPIAREMNTVLLVPGQQSQSGFPELVRLTGGNKSTPPSWVHSKYQIVDDTINELLNFRSNKKLHGINFQEVQPSKFDMQEAARNASATEMDLD